MTFFDILFFFAKRLLLLGSAASTKRDVKKMNNLFDSRYLKNKFIYALIRLLLQTATYYCCTAFIVIYFKYNFKI